MSKFVGVADINLLLCESAVKRAALICDHISFSAYHLLLAMDKIFDGKALPMATDTIDKIDQLKANGIVIDAPPELGSEEALMAFLELLLLDEREHIQKIREKVIQNVTEHEEIEIISRAGMARRAALRIQKSTGWNTVVIDTPDAKYPSLLKKGNDHVLSMIMNFIPEPSIETPWAAIIEYRQDEDAKKQFTALKHWINTALASSKSIKELEDELAYLINEYKDHMKLHHMKIELGTMETVVVASAELLENLVKFKFGKAAKALFAVQKKKVELLEAERQAPGRQLAYIINARGKFSPNT